jgi:hypothetical protein
MRKTDKKIDNHIRIALTDVCDNALKTFIGFQWLTHLVSYAHFPTSLRVVCVFDRNAHLEAFMAQSHQYELSELLQKKLLEIDIKLSNIDHHITYDTEENCDRTHNGKWADRLAKLSS